MLVMKPIKQSKLSNPKFRIFFYLFCPKICWLLAGVSFHGLSSTWRADRLARSNYCIGVTLRKHTPSPCLHNNTYLSGLFGLFQLGTIMSCVTMNNTAMPRPISRQYCIANYPPDSIARRHAVQEY